jgi:hypothetical protein
MQGPSKREVCSDISYSSLLSCVDSCQPLSTDYLNSAQLRLSGMSGLDCWKLSSFDKERSCHLQGKYVLMARNFWKPFIGQVVGGELDVIVLTGGAEERAAAQ